MTSPRKGRSTVMSMARHPVIASVRFTTNGASNPTVVSDPCKILNGAVAYSATGILTMTLIGRYARIHAHSGHDDADTIGELETEVTEGTNQVNTVVVKTWSDAAPQVALQTTGVVITCTMFLYMHT
jgi:hypothetical protein